MATKRKRKGRIVRCAYCNGLAVSEGEEAFFCCDTEQKFNDTNVLEVCATRYQATRRIHQYINTQSTSNREKDSIERNSKSGDGLTPEGVKGNSEDEEVEDDEIIVEEAEDDPVVNTQQINEDFRCPDCNHPVEKYGDCQNPECMSEIIWSE